MNEKPPKFWREAEVEDWAVDKARKRGWWVRKFTSPSRRSAPDDVFARHGRVFWIEFKATGAKPTFLQEQEHEKMRAAGLTVYVCDSREGFDTIMANEDLEWDT